MDIRAALTELCDAFNAHELDRIMACFADDCVLEMPRGTHPWGTRFEGQSEVRRALASRFEGLPDVHYGETQHFVDESASAGMTKWLLTGTARDGSRTRVHGCDFYTFRDGKAVRKDSYWKIVQPGSDPMLVSPAWLHERLGEVHVLDCTTFMTPQPVGPSRIESGLPAFERGHIPGAQHVDMVDDFSDPDGRFPYTLPDASQIERVLGGLGISNDDMIVLYSSTHLMVATRVWYVLRAHGHRRVAILDGGLAAWEAAGLPVSTTVGQVTPTGYQASPDRSRYAARDEVAAAAGNPGAIVINALSAEQFAGTGGAHYGRPGRIPGSVSVPTATILTDDGRSFAPVETIREQLRAQGVHPDREVITYCGGGIAATVDAFALELIGHDKWAVYDNSLLEWSSDPDQPMDRD